MQVSQKGDEEYAVVRQKCKSRKDTLIRTCTVLLSSISQVTLPDMAPANLPVPEVLRQYAEDEIQNWIRTRFEAMEANGQRELAVRPFCRWLDRNMEPIFTEGEGRNR